MNVKAAMLRMTSNTYRVGELMHLADAHIFSMKPGGKSTTGIRSEKILIYNVQECLQCSGKTKYLFDLPSPISTKTLLR